MSREHAPHPFLDAFKQPRSTEHGRSSENEPIEDVTREIFEIHEVTDVFDRIGYPLNLELQQLLGEHNPEGKDPRFERYGSGFTKATYYLAKLTREPRSPEDMSKVLDPEVIHKIEDDLYRQNGPDYEMTTRAVYETLDRAKIRQAANSLSTEGGKLVGNLIADILCPEPLPKKTTALPPAKQKIELGACTSAEFYFLQIAGKIQPTDRRPWRYAPEKGKHINIITDTDGSPLMVEKIGLGENHSCITLKETTLNGVRLPPGSLVGIRYRAEQQPTLDEQNKGSEEQIIPLSAIEGAQFLRLTTLAVSPAERVAAFRGHIDHQEQNAMPGHRIATIEDIRQRADAIQESKTPFIKRLAKKLAS